MCGIAGYQSADGSALAGDILARFREALAHRGPDGSGEYIAAGAGLTQTRLAIIDLETGSQPLFGPGETALVANGEIYNYIELARDYPSSSLTTQSDCELPLLEFGRARSRFTEKLRGMFAIALVDYSSKALHLARDPFGIKPLYRLTTEKGLFFASEPRAFFAANIATPVVDPAKAVELLQLQFTTGTDTIYRGVRRLQPGETVEVRSGGLVREGHVSAVSKAPPIRDEEAALVLLDQVLMESVNIHQRSDVPYGMFLSGGVDSSAILACMARLNEKPVRAFTAGFPGTEARDEREHAKRVARAAGAEHIEIAVTEGDFWTHLPSIAAAMDDPAADYAIVPTYLLAREAAKELKVVLCGEGGDELFAGYGRYRRAARWAIFGGRRMYARGGLEGLGLLREENGRWRAGIEAAEQHAAAIGFSGLQAAQAVDIAEWLPNDLLIKLDRCLMANGVEGRTPFLDREVGNFAFNLPAEMKVRNGGGKYLLRRWLAGALPEAEPFKPKRGFTVPVGEWIASKAAMLARAVAANEGIAQICRPDEVERLFLSGGTSKRQAQARWRLLFYALWHRVHIERKIPAGDVQSLLGDP